jgi:hypothetical protein
MWLITGSVAQLHWFPDSRLARDVDIITPDQFTPVMGKMKDACVPIDTKFDTVNQYILEHNRDRTFVDARFLLATKLACIPWARNNQRNLWDVKFLTKKGVKPNRTVYEMLLDSNETRWGKPDYLEKVINYTRHEEKQYGSV